MSNLLPTGKAAKYIGVSKWTLRRWVAAGRIKPKSKKKSGYLAFDKADLDALVSSGNHKKYRKAPKSQHAGTTAKNVKKTEPRLLPQPRGDQGKAREAVVVIEERKETIIVPNTGQSKKGIAGIFRRFFGSSKRLTMFLLAVLSFASFRTATVVTTRPLDIREAAVDEGTVLSYQVPVMEEKPFNWLDSVIAAASDSGEGTPSVQFLITGGESVKSLFSPDAQTPQTGNPAYTGQLTSYPMWLDSPYAYLSGERGIAGPVAIIEKADTLTGQPFFANVEDGDKLLIYRDANRAILIRPLTNSVIAFGPLDTVAGENPFVSGITSTGNQPTFLLRNGMPGDQDTKVFESDLKYRIPEASVVASEKAMRSDYKKTTMIDATHGAKVKEAQAYARKLAVPLVELPPDEPYAPAGVDFIVIVGTDRK